MLLEQFAVVAATQGILYAADDNPVVIAEAQALIYKSFNQSDENDENKARQEINKHKPTGAPELEDVVKPSLFPRQRRDSYGGSNNVDISHENDENKARQEINKRKPTGAPELEDVVKPILFPRQRRNSYGGSNNADISQTTSPLKIY
ncbi:hypothetical protein SUGI_0365830 [Cryptomeria japonica]|nr:hypothetical protein SUGI_0365830 [Cryptomeria japonica]